MEPEKTASAQPDSQLVGQQGVAAQNRRGCDYSSRVVVMFVGDMTLPRLMNEDILGVMPLAAIDGRPLGFNFILRSRQAAQELFDLLLHWASQRGGTGAVDLEFLIRDSGEVVLLCSENLDAVTHLFCPKRYQLDLRPLVYIGMSRKSFPQPSAVMRMLLANGSLHDIDIGAFVVQPDNGPHSGFDMPELNLHKDELPVYRESEVKLQSLSWTYLQIPPNNAGDGRPGGTVPPEPFTPPDSTFSERRQRMHRLFPISLAILSGSTAAVSVKESLLGQSYRTWQIWQAECNLITSKRRSLAVGQKEGGKRLSQVDMVEFLIDQPEMVSNTDLFDGILAEENIREQIAADASELLGRYNTAIDRTMTTAEVQPALARLELLGEVDDQF
ncbi:hypothetical protein [Candidatus Cryosericum septentrionale]|jgi:hypothetical protein|uniref:Uncharacterized protein n=1 Tax=Candidatus Cryosericum septentrionale TaxID=2290913 RepID=A0A398DKI2_9BACT|nr:hypothetical protein [Candidatus Cryosericum septentrionale]RIE15390.1 hypothetical protein SMC1_10235 [Candidatus Cryosericum septentrionale]